MTKRRNIEPTPPPVPAPNMRIARAVALNIRGLKAIVFEIPRPPPPPPKPNRHTRRAQKTR